MCLFVHRYVALRVQPVLVVSRLCTSTSSPTLIRVLVRLTLHSIWDIGTLIDLSNENRLCRLNELVSPRVSKLITVARCGSRPLPCRVSLLGLLKLSAFRAVFLDRLLTRRLRKRVVVCLSALVRKLGRIRHLVSPALNSGPGNVILMSLSRRDRLPHLRIITDRRRLLSIARSRDVTL